MAFRMRLAHILPFRQEDDVLMCLQSSRTCTDQQWKRADKDNDTYFCPNGTRQQSFQLALLSRISFPVDYETLHIENGSLYHPEKRIIVPMLYSVFHYLIPPGTNRPAKIYVVLLREVLVSH